MGAEGRAAYDGALAGWWCITAGGATSLAAAAGCKHVWLAACAHLCD
jgi:hypothetical protein